MTPAQKQYMELKSQNKDCLLLFRMGDFYEAFFQDAKTLSKELDIVLTYKDKNCNNPTPMAGVPFHSIDKYLPKLIQKGYKIAIAEQIGTVIPGQLVKREVVNILTPGTFLDQENKDYNYICAITSFESNEGNYHIAYGDFSIGEYFTKSFIDFEKFLNYIIKLNANEIILDIDFLQKQELKEQIKMYLSSLINIYDIPYDSESFLKNNLNVESLDGFGKSLSNPRDKSFAMLLNYLLNTQKQSLKNINKISYISEDEQVNLDQNTIRNLEIFKSSYEGDKKHTLFSVINNTKSGMGNRKMIDIISNPIKNIIKLNKRLEHIDFLKNNEELCQNLIQEIQKLNDIPKIISSIIYKRNSPVLRAKLKNSLSTIFNKEKSKILEYIQNNNFENININQEKINKILNFFNKIDIAISEQANENEYIKEGYSEIIDNARNLANNSSELILKYQQEIVNHTKVNAIKIKYIKNQGYFIETSKKDCKDLEKTSNVNIDKFDFVRVQTLKNQERYISTYLQNIQEEIFKSKEKLVQEQKKILENLLSDITILNQDLNELSEGIGFIDIFTNIADLSNKNGWCKPTITDIDQKKIDIKQGRHPVIEKYLPINENFVANDLFIDEKSTIQIITGPNMGGKSTYLRQNAIIVLLAHCGFFVPAKTAKISIVDGIYARVGSGDIIAKNQSTFLTEMIELANIINNSSEKSFIILDELGRGTSTYDGVAIAKSIVQFIAEKTKAKTMFATHYHELIDLEKKYKNVKNYSVAVYENQKEVVFLKKIVKGGANKSYGIDVAKIAGLPNEILNNAKKHLKDFENNKINITATPLFEFEDKSKQDNEELKKIKNELNNIDINNITPIQAMQILSKLKNI
ncbi:DNA mismatch repair protein MutS [Candidatus Vampirococcus lugosii]|uniref:DNA mismatch repair protein MutS n=1 Tax=Candidatus Vampirococcus lugosii TaxID=2789015 RepID=A0ABS5QLE0_9BACT|nr:DNA mismatch repair protein MutS [Candidatus Vampirococcus lugosii]